MTMASLGWGAWWIALVLQRYAPTWAPHPVAVAWIAGGCAAIGLLATVWGVRARLAWLLFLALPAFANASLLAVPWVLGELRSTKAPPAAPLSAPAEAPPAGTSPRR